AAGDGFRLRLDLGGDAAELFHRGHRAVEIGHDANRDTDQRVDLFLPLPVAGDERATRDVFERVERAALAVPGADDAARERLHTFGSGDEDEVVAADVAQEIARVALGALAFRRHPPQQPDEVIAA